MTGIRHSFALIIGALALFFAGQAYSQEQLGYGKSPAQLYASDCAICHKSPRGLSGAGGIFGLESFLRSHYTASRESAAAIAAYLRLVDRGPAPAERRRVVQPKRQDPNKPAEKDTAGEKKPDAKASDSKPAEAKPADNEKKPAEAQAAEKKPADGKASETNDSAPKPGDAKASAPKSDSPAATTPETKPN